MKLIKELNLGVKYMLFSSFLFAVMGAFAKLSSDHMSSLEVVFFRNIFGVLLIGAAVLKSPMKNVGGKPWLLFFRGFMGFTALLAFFYNIAHIPLGDAMTFSKTSPIFTAIFDVIPTPTNNVISPKIKIFLNKLFLIILFRSVLKL